MKTKFLFVFLFSIFLMQFASATAQFIQIPDQNINFNKFKIIDLDQYCSSSSGGICEPSSYRLQFLNPDNNQQVILFPGSSSSNSYYNITLYSDGVMQINSQSRSIVTTVNLYGSDVPLTSQNSTKFTLRIQEVQKPIQVQSLAPLSINGNETRTIFLDNVFSGADSYSVLFTDSNLSRNVFLTTEFLQNDTICSNGQIRLCLSQAPDILFVGGLNQSFNGTLILRAKNTGGETTLNLNLVIVPFGRNTYSLYYSSLPIRKPINIAPIYMETGNNSAGIWNKIFDGYPKYIGESRQFNFDDVYGNYTSIKLQFTHQGTNYSMYANRSGTGSRLGLTMSTWFINGTGVAVPPGAGYPLNLPAGISTDDDVTLGFLSVYNNDKGLNLESWNVLYIESYLTDINLTINVSACNNVGCVSSDFFNRQDQINLFVVSTPPVAELISLADIIMDFNEIKVVDINTFYSNFDNITIFWSEGSNNYSLSTPVSGVNSFTYLSGTTPVYQISLYSSNLMSVTSANTNHNFTVTFQACNHVACINGSEIRDTTLEFIIRDNSSIEISDFQTSNIFWRNMYNIILTLFPDPDQFTATQKANIIMVTFTAIMVLGMYFGYRSGHSLLPAIYVSAFICFLALIFFIARGYISTIVIVSALLVSLGFLFLKFRGGGNS